MDDEQADQLADRYGSVQAVRDATYTPGEVRYLEEEVGIEGAFDLYLELRREGVYVPEETHDVPEWWNGVAEMEYDEGS